VVLNTIGRINFDIHAIEEKAVNIRLLFGLPLCSLLRILVKSKI
jgi:hypothetical protein